MGDGSGPARARRLAKPLFDSLLIVFGVVLGFVVNDWAQNRAQRARAAQALAAIRQELVANRALFADAHAFHVGIRDSIAVYVARRAPVPKRIWYGNGMFSPARPVSAAWESARTTGVTGDLPYGLVLTLSDAYASQQLYATVSYGLAQGMYADLLRHGPEAVFRDRAPNFGILASDWSKREARLMAQCDSAVARIDRVQGRPHARPTTP